MDEIRINNEDSGEVAYNAMIEILREWLAQTIKPEDPDSGRFMPQRLKGDILGILAIMKINEEELLEPDRIKLRTDEFTEELKISLWKNNTVEATPELMANYHYTAAILIYDYRRTLNALVGIFERRKAREKLKIDQVKTFIHEVSNLANEIIAVHRDICAF